MVYIMQKKLTGRSAQLSTPETSLYELFTDLCTLSTELIYTKQVFCGGVVDTAQK